MKEFLWHGRGGQGAFTAARLLGAAYALSEDGHYALAFPSFGPERRGAPMRAFTKLDTKPIGDRSEVGKADCSIFLDDTLFSEAAFHELKDGGFILLNTKHEAADPRVISIDADGIAEALLGRPITNTVMLGALSALEGGITLSDVETAIRTSMPEKLQEKNMKTAEAAAARVKKLLSSRKESGKREGAAQ